MKRRGVSISLWDRLRSAVGHFMGYGYCIRCHRSWWFQPMGEGVPIDRDGKAIPDPDAYTGSARHALCRVCESDLTFDQRLNFDIAFVQLREWGDYR